MTKYQEGYADGVTEAFLALVESFSRVLTVDQMVAMIKDECSCDPSENDCMDCGLDTLAMNEYYMVKKKIWKIVNPGVDGMLCIGCLEDRLGRQLTAADFTKAPLNHNGKTVQSDRLINRLGE